MTASQTEAQSIVRPSFLTFTGIDVRTDLDAAAQLMAEYPVEFGVLFHPAKQGVDNRYPPLVWIGKNLLRTALPLSAHLCGGDALRAMEDGRTPVDTLVHELAFVRAQINCKFLTDAQIDRIATWAHYQRVQPISQCRGRFPADGRINWLFDESGGRGVLPNRWPTERPERMHGFAGGLNPDNIRDVLSQINSSSGRYWLDMETGVRTDGWFDLAKCRAVCEEVYGPAGVTP